MIEETGNIWDFIDLVDAICITTNGFVTNSDAPKAVMGRGTANQAKNRFPGLDIYLAMLLNDKGNITQECCKVTQKTVLIAFPVKPASIINFDPKTDQVVSHAKGKYRKGDSVPGFHAVADLKIIEKSAKELVFLANDKKYSEIVLPRPGCGAGELEWSSVKPILESILDDRFIVMSL